jgi:hypothetical protein
MCRGPFIFERSMDLGIESKKKQKGRNISAMMPIATTS